MDERVFFLQPGEKKQQRGFAPNQLEVRHILETHGRRILVVDRLNKTVRKWAAVAPLATLAMLNLQARSAQRSAIRVSQPVALIDRG